MGLRVLNMQAFRFMEGLDKMVLLTGSCRYCIAEVASCREKKMLQNPVI
jgi:hypothetical protein